MSGKIFRVSAGFAALSMVLGSTAHAAPSAFSPADPLLSLSVFGTSSSRAAVCAAGSAAAGAAATAATTAATAATTAAQPGTGGPCVLPVLGAAPPPPVVGTAPPVQPVVGGGGFSLGGLLPLFAILGLTALAVYLLEKDDDNFPPPMSPF